MIKLQKVQFDMKGAVNPIAGTLPGMSDELISWDRVCELRSEVGADDFDEIVVMFLDETEETLRELSEAGDPQLRQDLLHALRGSALNLGFHGLSRLCEASEETPGTDEFAAMFERSRTDLVARLKAA